MNNQIYTVSKIKELLAPVFQAYHVQRAVLFGSYAQGVATANSDIDLCVDSGLKGMRFVGLMESVREALGGKDLDMFDTTHVEAGSNVSEEIKQTGVTIYEG